MELEKVLQILRQKMTFKSTTSPGDIILVGMPTGLSYGSVQAIEKNTKNNWFNFGFTLLSIPPVAVTWILRLPQMNGEIFTIDKEEHFVIAVDACCFESPKNNQKSPKEKPRSHNLRLIKTE